MRYRKEQLQLFEMYSWVVMANHVHVLITPHVEVSKLMHSLKRFTAREANKILGLTGQPFWQDESYDHLVRGEAEFQRIVEYMR
jgi:REP element-mobilizing transposase RayT